GRARLRAWPENACARRPTVVPSAQRDSLDLLVRIDAPELILHHPPVEARSGDPTPAPGTALHRSQHAGLELRQNRGIAVALIVQRNELILVLRRYQRGALAGQEGVIDPPLRAFPVANPPPVVG